MVTKYPTKPFEPFRLNGAKYPMAKATANDALNVRVKAISSFPNLLEPRAAKEGDKPRYGISLYIRKDDKATMDKVNAALNAAKAEKFPKGAPKNLPQPIKDGAEVYEEAVAMDKAKPGQEAQRDYFIISAYSPEHLKPATLNRFMQEATADDVGSNREVYASLRAFVYDTPKVGVTFALNGVLFTGQSGPFTFMGGKPTAEQMFGDLAEELAPQDEELAPTQVGEFSV